MHYKITMSFLAILLFTFNTLGQTVADFKNVNLDSEGFWNGSDGSGGLRSGNIFFPNFFNTEYSSWSGFAVSNITDNTTPGWANQYSAITGKGYEENPNYGVAYVSDPDTYENRIFLHLRDVAKGGSLEGMYVTNSTWAALSMQQGDEYTKKFGGTEGNDPDWFLLEIIAWHQGSAKQDQKIEVYLADFRFEDNDKDYILDTWKWVDLSNLGNADSLELKLSSSDMSDWGMNTPAYFCFTHLTTSDNGPTVSAPAITHKPWQVFPNPFSQNIRLQGIDTSVSTTIRIFDLTGKMVYQQSQFSGQDLELGFLPNGIYMLRVEQGQQKWVRRIIKQ